MGSISPLEKGKARSKCRRWRLFVSCGTDENGVRIQRSRNVRGTYSDAKEELLRFENECLGVTSSDATFKEYAESYLKRRRPQLKPSTYENRVSIIKTLVKVFGSDIKMSQLTPQLIEDKMNGLLVRGVRSNLDKPCKPSYVATLTTYLSSICLDAVQKGVITKSPLDGVKRAGGKPDKREPPTIEQVRELVHELDVHDKHEMAVMLIALLGVRRGEACALRWQDIDFDNGIIHIRHNLQTNCVLSSPKTESSRRDLPMPDMLRKALIERKAIVERNLARSVRAELLDRMPQLDDVFVVCDEMGRAMSPVRQTGWWANNRAKFGMVGVTEHDLRHAYLTALAMSGVHPSVAQALAGHATSAITMEVYTNVDMSAKVAGVAIFDEAMKLEDESD